MANSDSTAHDLRSAARSLLEFELERGGVGLPAARYRVEQAPPETRFAAPAAARDDAADAKVAPAEKVGLAELAEQIMSCTRCGLHRGRKQTVFARGNPAARLAFVGEGPGAVEDARGLPFVGPAGQLLDRMIAAMGLDEHSVYICNTVKCRPPENRTPLPDEVAACMPYLVTQLEMVAPAAIVALGRCAAQALGVAAESGPWRGRWGQWRGIPCLPTYHPAFLLRSPEFKRDAWADLQSVMQRMGLKG